MPSAGALNRVQDQDAASSSVLLAGRMAERHKETWDQLGVELKERRLLGLASTGSNSPAACRCARVHRGHGSVQWGMHDPCMCRTCQRAHECSSCPMPYTNPQQTMGTHAVAVALPHLTNIWKVRRVPCSLPVWDQQRRLAYAYVHSPHCGLRTTVWPSLRSCVCCPLHCRGGHRRVN